MEEFHSRYLICTGEVVEGHFDGAPFDGLEGVGEVRNGGFDAGFQSMSVSVLLDLVRNVSHDGEIGQKKGELLCWEDVEVLGL